LTRLEARQQDSSPGWTGDGSRDPSPHRTSPWGKGFPAQGNDGGFPRRRYRPHQV